MCWIKTNERGKKSKHSSHVRKSSAPFVHLPPQKKYSKQKWNTKNPDDETNKLTNFFCFSLKKKQKQTKKTKTKYTVCICTIIQKSYNGFLCRWFLYQIERIKRDDGEKKMKDQRKILVELGYTQIEREFFDWLGRTSNKAEQMRATTRGADRTYQRKWEKEFDWKSGFPFFPSTQRFSSSSSSLFKTFNG